MNAKLTQDNFNNTRIYIIHLRALTQFHWK